MQIKISFIVFIILCSRSLNCLVQFVIICLVIAIALVVVVVINKLATSVVGVLLS